MSFWCHGIGLDRNGDRQLVGVYLVPLHSLAMSEQMTASALVRNDRFDSLLNHFNRFSQGQELRFIHSKIVSLSDNSGSLEISRFR